MEADLIILNGYLASPDRGELVKCSLAARNGRVLALGPKERVMKFSGPKTRIIDLEGRVLLPGLSDAHVHGLALGRCLTWADLSKVRSIKELLRMLEEHERSLGPGDWLVGFGWDHELLAERRLPNKHDLDAVSTGRPIAIFRKCWHLCVLNSAALGALGDAELKDLISRGEVLLEPETGEPSGVLVEGALEAVKEAMPELDVDGALRAIKMAISKALEEGLTCLHWIAEGPVELAALMALWASGELGVRLYVLLPVRALEHVLALGLRTGFGDERLRFGALKLVLDGSLGARTAYLREPYADDPGNRGMLLYGEHELKSIALKAHEAGLQLAIHAIGDGAIELALRALSELPGGPGPMRHRIEHASVLSPELIGAMASLGVVASVQPRFVVSDFWVEQRLGPERARWAYPFRSLLEVGVPLAAGSDAPVEPVDPLEGMLAAIGPPQRPEERLSIWQALHAYTLGAAFASFQEHHYGSLEPGMIADMTVLSCGPEDFTPEGLAEAEVVATFVLGELKFAREAF